MSSEHQELPPLPKILDGVHDEVTLEFKKCEHTLESISSVEVKCIKCGAGWTGQGVYKLLQTPKNVQ